MIDIDEIPIEIDNGEYACHGSLSGKMILQNNRLCLRLSITDDKEEQLLDLTLKSIQIDSLLQLAHQAQFANDSNFINTEDE